jgi:hypothetical protein
LLAALPGSGAAAGADCALAHWQAAANTMVNKVRVEFIEILLGFALIR